ncbi:SusC/RagA family TonB-linked outer membrane protein [uncultured Sanguibacteroides sp.]|uniref:SusC/RagA family TonB-linked outer membrane protein n=1 Tax=uncultured Sanguibacteroides sp. TaxID=1635151 RepID=UPI0025F132B9|nr:SusC/RagA family TonB-linked outer membrane protein [uncultured Sanguibacteroides sp.]
MKLTFLMCLIFFGTLSANVMSQQKLSMSLGTTNIKRVFEEIRKQTNLIVIYNDDKLMADQQVKANFKEVELTVLLSQILKGSKLGYKFVDDYIVLIPITEMEQDSSKHENLFIEGIVKDINNIPLPGVAVVIKGTALGVATDNNGLFKIKLPRDTATLIFSFIGMETKEVEIKKLKEGETRKILTVQLKPEVSEINEVVVTGYQTIEKRKLSSSIVSINGADVLVGTGLSIDQMLQGRLLGVLVMNQTSTPGAAPKIRIRGSSSITGNREPVWVIDGIILEDPVAITAEELNSLDKVNLIGNAISSLNPEDIERIDILKDASATAIYGVKAANGVIVITTKRGRSGKPKVSLSTGMSITSAPSYNKMFRMNSRERIELSEEMRERGLKFSSFRPTIGYEKAVQDLENNLIDQNQFDATVEELKNINTDWYDLLFRTAVSHKHTLSISGGNNDTDYYFSIGFGNDEGVTRKEKQNQYNVRMRINTRLLESLRVGFTLSGSLTQTQRPHSSVDLYEYAYQTSRAIPAYDKQGNYMFYFKEYALASGYPLSYNILNELENTGSKVKNQTFGMDFTLDWDITSWLRFSSLINISTNNNYQTSWAGEKSYYVADLRQLDYGQPLPEDDWMFTEMFCELPYGGELRSNDTRNFAYTIRNSIQVAKQFGSHDFLFLGGNEIRSIKYNGLNSVQWGYLPDRGKKFVNTSFETWKQYAYKVQDNPDIITDNLNNYLSFYGTFTYGYDDRYIANFNIRADGSNKFGQDKSVRFLPVWSLSGRWNIKNEKFMTNVKWLNNLAIRASYGIQGNVHPDQTPNLIVEMGTLWSGANEYASRLNKFPNKKLKWEKTKAFNLGMDFSLFRDRLFGTVEFYKKKGIDQVVHKTLAPSTGADYVSINDGDVENKGWELSFSLVPIRTKEVTWSLSFNTSKNYNKVSRAGEKKNTTVEDYINGSLVVNGKALDSFYSYQFKELDNNGFPTFNGQEETNDKGEMIVSSQKEAIERALTYSGQRTPDLSGGFSTSISYKGFTLNGLFSFSMGSKIRLNDLYKSSGQSLPYPQQNLSSELVHRWRKPGDQTHTNIPVLSDDNLVIYLTDRKFEIGDNKWEMYNKSDLRVVSGDFLRCRSLSLRYDFNTLFLKMMRMSSASLSLDISNPFVIKDKALKGRDPEQVTMGAGTVPPQRNYALTLRVSF